MTFYSFYLSFQANDEEIFLFIILQLELIARVKFGTFNRVPVRPNMDTYHIRYRLRQNLGFG